MVEDELNFFYVSVGSRSKFPRLAQVFRYNRSLTVTGNDSVLIHITYLLTFLSDSKFQQFPLERQVGWQGLIARTRMEDL